MIFLFSLLLDVSISAFSIIDILLAVLRLLVSQVKVPLVFGDVLRFAKDEAPNSLVNIQVLANVFSHMPLQNQLVVLLAKVLEHLLVAASVDLGQLHDLLSFGLLRDCLVQVHLVKVHDEPVNVSYDVDRHD